ncbi:MAG: NTP transferase domain-containing protein [Phycisphaera sp.]|nr:NTP transferase domain-containing protein [Phycisphaera sp.]
MSNESTNTRPLEAIILAAGKGTRMGSDLAKVLHPVADRPMVDWVLDACEAVGCRRNVVVVGHQADAVRDALSDRATCVFVEQTEQLGTGHAVMVTEPAYPDAASRATDVLVLCGDGPLIRTETLQTMLDTHRAAHAAATLATAVLDDPTGYGRIVRDDAGRFERIVEHKDATDAERAIHEVNPSYYCFDAAALFDTLSRVTNDNAKGEYYITDVLGLLIEAGERVEVIDAVPAEDVLSINTPEQLAEVDAILRQRVNANTEVSR